MNFSDSILASLLTNWTKSIDIHERAEAHNVLFEERLHVARLTTFQDSLTGPCTDYLMLRDKLSDFVRHFIEVALPHAPKTFTANATNMKLPSSEQKLVRIENITRHLMNAGLTAAELEKSLSSKKPAKSAVAERFVDGWNIARDARPAFAAFKDQLLAEIEDFDWPHKLRDRLGLSHYSAAGGPLDVALIEYSVEEVVDEANRSTTIAHPICFPTFLDMKPNSQFFPTPRELPSGSPMALFEVWSDECLVAEVLHSRLTYKKQHIVKIGKIVSKGPLVAMNSLRNNHLAALQLAATRDTFGEEM